MIKKYSAEIALNIEKGIPGTYFKSIVEKLNKVGVSQFPEEVAENYPVRIDSYWHQKGKIDTSLKFYHGWDFERYWFEPLGNVFGVSAKQVMALATYFIANELEISISEDIEDPRKEIWRSSRNDRETWHDHGSYPKVDNYQFYLSYHAMFIVASKLLQKMPIVKSRDWYDDEWSDWLQRHSLTGINGQWLSDRRDPPPLRRPKWISTETDIEWPSKADFNDFYGYTSI